MIPKPFHTSSNRSSPRKSVGEPTRAGGRARCNRRARWRDKGYTEIGRGTQFNIYLPVSHDDAYRPPEEYRTTIPHEGPVLIVEDESIISSMAETMLLEAG